MPEDIALLKESRNQIAVRHGLPPIGAVMVNQHGIEWLVDGHLHVPTLATITRRGVDRDDSEDPLDLYPVIIPQNLSPLLTQFIAETSRCTSKSIMPVDTMPSLRPHSAHPESYAIDGQTSPYRIVVFLDAAHVHETILAHEIGHVWIDLVDDCEDYRMLNDLSNTARVFQWTSIQSFVLDLKVNEALREKGFDTSIIAGHVEEALANISLAVLSGYRPPEPREAAFLAMTLASAMLDEEMGAMDALQSLDVAAMVCQRDLPDVYELACQFAASVRRHGYHNRASIRKAIDACASLSFEYVGEPLNLAQDVVEETPEECFDDKYPQWFPGLPIAAKLEIGKAMARQRIPGEAEWQLSYSPGGSIQIQFRQESGSWTPPVILHHAHCLPHAPYFAGRQPARQKANPIMNKPVMHPSTHNPAVPQRPVISPPLPPAVQTALPFAPIYPGTPKRRSYSPGLAVFLSRVRLEEQLSGEHPYSYAYNNPINYIDPDGNKPPKPAPKQEKTPGLPETMRTDCLTKQAQETLLRKLKNKTCADAIKAACKASGLVFMNDTKIIPGWIFPDDCGPQFPYGRCIMNVTPNPIGLRPGDPCKVRGICITQAGCKSGPDRSACLVIWELGNACECKNKGYQPGESTAATLAKACGCSAYVGPGGVIIRPGGGK